MSVLRKNAIYNVLLSITQLVLPLVTFPYAARVLGPNAMGAVSLADNFTIYFLIFSALGIPLYGLREVAKVKKDPVLLGKTYSSLLFIHLASAILAAGLLFIISWQVQKLSANFALYQIGIAIILGNVFIGEWFFQGLEEFKYITLRTVLIRLLTIPLVFLFVKAPGDKAIYFGLNLIVTVLSAGFNMYFITKKINISFYNLAIKRHLRPLLLIWASALVTTIYVVFDTVILGFLTDDAIVGYYAVAMRIAKISLTVLGAVSIALLPRLSLLFHQNDHHEATLLLNKSLRLVCFFSVPIAMGICCSADEIISVFAGGQFLPSVNSLRLLSFLVVLIGLAQVFSNQILLPLKQEKKILYATIVGVIISLSLNFTLIPIFLHIGAAISALLTELIVTLLLYLYVKRYFVVIIPFNVFFKSLLSTSLFFVSRYLVLQLTTIPLFVLTFTIVISVVSYFLVQLLIWKNKDMLDLLADYPVLGFLNKLK